MKKSLLITIEFPPQIGGVSAVYYNVCKNLPADKIVVLTSEVKNSENFDQKQNYKIIRQNLLTKIPFIWPKWLPAVFLVQKIIKNEEIKILLVGQILPLGAVAWFIKRWLKIPFIVFVHGMDITVPKGRKKIILKKILKEADYIITNSNFSKKEVLKLLFPDVIARIRQLAETKQSDTSAVIPSERSESRDLIGIATPPEDFRVARNDKEENKVKVVYPCPSLEYQKVNEQNLNEIKEKYNLKNKKILLTIGRLVERKGQDMVIKSLPEVLKKIPNLVYVIIGDGPYHPELEKLVQKYQIEKNVLFTGLVSEKDLLAFYQLCDVFIMVSRQLKNKDVEGFGIVYLEANLFKKPVIAGQSGGVQEAVIDNQTGLLIDPENISAISQAIIRLLTDKNLAEKLGRQGKERVLREFNWQKQAGKIQRILE